MSRTRRLLATLAVIVMAGVGTAQGVPDKPRVAPAVTTNAADSVRPGPVPESTAALGVPDKPTVAPAGTTNAADSVRPGPVPESTTALVVLCFPGAGCIVCHNGYCEYTSRV